jgi:hypothetical protein
MNDAAREPEAQAAALLAMLARDDGPSLPRAAKALGLRTSELQRLLVALGDDPRLPGLALVEARVDGERTRLWLTAKGRALCAGA